MEIVGIILALAIVAGIFYGIFQIWRKAVEKKQERTYRIGKAIDAITLPDLRSNSNRSEIHMSTRTASGEPFSLRLPTEYKFDNMLKAIGMLLKREFELSQELKNHLLLNSNFAYIEKDGETVLDENFNVVKYHSTNKFTSVVVDNKKIDTKNIVKENSRTDELYASKLQLTNVQNEIGSGEYKHKAFNAISAALDFTIFLPFRVGYCEDETSKNEIDEMCSTNITVKDFATEILCNQLVALLFCFAAYKNLTHCEQTAIKLCEEIFEQIKPIETQEDNQYDKPITYKIENENFTISGYAIYSPILSTNQFILQIKTK